MPTVPTVPAARARITRRRLRRLRRRDQWMKATIYPTPTKLTGAYGRGSAPLPFPLTSPHAPYLTRRRLDVDRTPTSPFPRYLTRTPKRYRRWPR
ncbi:hypothetical protein OG730_41575 (plasmid) [Streptomyces sp. NBC_01298]|uniref:hypothetical protein n=1 Tax=Streptomyces sp. NBC_01298 TaxID=2903817 RepID=UPI002E0F76CD|nr:hypothetical protein OG730_41575 [Streptomyces sp. NBC_01298]